jgi:hypothetical protein
MSADVKMGANAILAFNNRIRASIEYTDETFHHWFDMMNGSMTEEWIHCLKGLREYIEAKIKYIEIKGEKKHESRRIATSEHPKTTARTKSA